MRFNNGLGPSQMETGEEDIRVELVRRKAWGRVGEQVCSGKREQFVPSGKSTRYLEVENGGS